MDCESSSSKISLWKYAQNDAIVEWDNGKQRTSEGLIDIASGLENTE